MTIPTEQAKDLSEILHNWLPTEGKDVLEGRLFDWVEDIIKDLEETTHDDSYAEGFEKGHDEGYDEGHEAGYEEGKRDSEDAD